MATFQQALQYAANNPNSEFAKNFGIEVASGRHDQEAQQFGFDTTPIKQKYSPIVEAQKQAQKPKETVIEKVAGFIGGKILGQGLGQAISNRGIAKQQEEALNIALEQQTQILKKRKEIADLGGDTSVLDNLLRASGEHIKEISGSTEELLNQKGITGKQIAGDVLQLGTTVLGAGQLPGVAKTATGATGVLAGAKQGAIQGVKAGTIFGASSGVSGALKEDKSAKDIVKEGVGGALVGAGTGGILGGIIGGVSGGIKANKLTKLAKKDEFALDLVSPKATTKVKEQALKEGRVTEAGLLNASKITPSKRDKQLAEVVKDIVDPKKSEVQNLNIIKQKVDDINTGVKAYVKINKSPFNTNQLTKQLNNGKDELNLVFASDKQAEKTYNAVVKEFLKNVKSKDTAGLFEARQKFDKIPAIKKLLDSQGLGENAKKEIVLTVRGQANKYVASLLPKGNQFRDTLLKESKMIEVLGNLAEKNASNIGANKLQLLTKKYPVLNWLAGGIGAGLVGGASIGVGRSIIGSSD